MKKLLQKYQDSLLELTVTKNVVLCGLMAALAVVLGLVATINIGPYVRIGFSGLPNRIVDCLFGPVTGALFGGALDLIKYFMKPDGPFYFGFTFNAMVAAVIYGTILYQKKVTVVRVVCAEFLTKAIVNCFLNTLFLSIIYGKAFFVILPLRVIKNIVMLPIDSAILYFTLTYVKKVVGHFGFLSRMPKTSKSVN